MKKTFVNIFAATAMLLPLSGCGDFLEVEPQNVITIDKFWNEQSDVENIIAGCYSAMESYGFISRMMIWGEFRSENIVPYGTTIKDDIDLERLLKENITANNSYTYWGEFYNVINRCNTVIQFAPQVAVNDPSYTESELKAHIAEVTALRSLCYFYLIRTFRDVPYSEEAYLEDGQTLDLPATKFEDVLDHLIASLEAVKDDAITKYPESSLNYSTGRVTKQAIWAMLCDMYLWKQDYTNCVKYADLVIEAKTKDAEEFDSSVDYSDFYGYPLIRNSYSGLSGYFGYAFNQIFVQGNSQESILELNFEKGSEGNRPSNGPVSNFYGNDSRTAFCKASDYVTMDVKATKPVVFNNKYDGRAYENFTFTTSGDPTGINKYTCGSQIVLGNPNTNSFFSVGEWGIKYPTYGKDYESRNKSNFILYRLTDVMLLKAEALSQQISDAAVLEGHDLELRDEAFFLVNAINKRALYQETPKDTLVLSDYSTKIDLTNLVYAERERELMLEGKRYFDLVRRSQRDGNTDYLRSVVKQKSSDNASIVESQLQKMDAIYWPYNLDEIKVNSHLRQNPAFGSGENSSYEKN